LFIHVTNLSSLCGAGLDVKKTRLFVRSYGILLWEVMSLGYMPYPGCANTEVMELVRRGGRLECPSHCPGPVYGIMTQCWHPNPDERPSFITILERLGYCLQVSDKLKSLKPTLKISGGGSIMIV
jgi:anaplastic lymphoma kinase